MEDELNNIKITIRSLLTSSKTQLTVDQLQKDFLIQEGKILPYMQFGFKSVIELLQSLKDVVNVPANPNQHSLLTAITNDKTNHIKMLIEKQKLCTKKKKSKFVQNQRSKNHEYNNNRNSSFSGNNTLKYMSNSNQSLPDINFNNSVKSTGNNYLYKSNTSLVNNYQNNRLSSYKNKNNFNHSETNGFNNKYQNTRHNLHRSNISSINNNQNNQSFLTTNSSGHVTNNLRLQIEKAITENKMSITVEELEKLVKLHQDFSALKARNMQDVIKLLQSFLDINERGVFLKNANTFENKKVPLIYPTNVKSINNNNTNMNNFNKFNCHKDDLPDPKILAKLSLKLKNFNYPHLINNNQKDDSYNDDNGVNIKSKICTTQSEVKCKNETMIEHSQAVNNIDVLSSTNNSIPSFYHSTPKHNIKGNIENVNISLTENHSLPKEVLLNIGRIFKKYRGGLNVDNYIFLYHILYNTIFDATSYGFESINQMFMILDQMIEVQNNILYTKNENAYFVLDENINYKNNNISTAQSNIISHIYSDSKLNISLSIEPPLIKFSNYRSEIKMVLAEVYNPSLFYLQLANKSKEFDCLMNQMQHFYDIKNTNYCVQPDQILLNSVYASSYSTFLSVKQWQRVRIVREIDTMTIEVYHIDYGTMDTIPKTELRFLKNEFCNLPCQAIHCCLTGYNEHDTIAQEVTESFLKLINNNSVLVQINENIIINQYWQVLHVTLFQQESIDSTKLININNELTIWHVFR